MMLDRILAALVDHPGGSLAFAPGRLARLQKKALAISQGDELYALVGELLSVASFLVSERNAREAALALMAVAESLVAKLDGLAQVDAKRLAQAAAPRLDEARARVDAARSTGSRGVFEAPRAGAGVSLHTGQSLGAKR